MYTQYTRIVQISQAWPDYSVNLNLVRPRLTKFRFTDKLFMQATWVIPTIIRGGGSRIQYVVLKNGMYLGQGSAATRFLSSQNNLRRG